MRYRILIVSLPESSKRAIMKDRLLSQHLPWEWIDGVRIGSMDDISIDEYSGLEAYCIPRLKQAPEYVCRAIGCKRAMRKSIDVAATCSEDWVIILQDDAELVCDFDRKLREYMVKVPYQAGAVMLHRTGDGICMENGLHRVVGNVRSMTAFAVRPSFASVVSLALAHWCGETDRIWQRLAERGEMILSSVPMLVSCSQKGSDIIGEIPELSYLWR